MLWNHPVLLSLTVLAFIGLIAWLNLSKKPPVTAEMREEDTHWRTGGIAPLEPQERPAEQPSENSQTA